MNPTPFKSETTPWRVQLPASLSPDGKRKARYFGNLPDAKRFCARLKKGEGLVQIDGAVAPAASVNEHAPLIMAAVRMLGGDSTQVFEACRHWEKIRLNVKGGILADVASAFQESRRGKLQADTWKDDGYRLRKLLAEYGNANILDLTEADLAEFFEDTLKVHPRRIFSTCKVFFKWARKKGFIAVNPMADLKPHVRWGARKDIYPVATFSRMLRIAAGLEACQPGEEPTRDFLPLLPWMIISGFCGLRSCEAFRSALTDDAIKWDDLKFERNPPFVHVRHDVAKRTKRESDKRNIKAAAHVEAARAWLELVPRESEFVVPAIERTLYNLKRQFEARTGIKFLGNAFRNSFASYALEGDGCMAGVGQLALEMGNSEAIAKQYYIETLDPRSGVDWFGLRPNQPSNVVPMSSAA